MVEVQNWWPALGHAGKSCDLAASCHIITRCGGKRWDVLGSYGHGLPSCHSLSYRHAILAMPLARAILAAVQDGA